MTLLEICERAIANLETSADDYDESIQAEFEEAFTPEVVHDLILENKRLANEA